jgi:ssDNA thymidine ADP-ribosyltransferase, DarT
MGGREPLDASIEAEAARREVSRLCHLTPFRNLLHIASGEGLRSVAELEDDRAAFDRQDLERLDRRPDHISCSIEYPNVWYLRRRRGDATPLQRLFPDWVCLLIEPSYLWAPGTEFAARNAAAGYGSHLKPGFEAFREMYASEVSGAHGRRYGREKKPEACPTDDQAEVMIEKRVALADARTIVFADADQAARSASALRLSGVAPEDFKFLLAPSFFDTGLSAMLRRGEKPAQTPWVPYEKDA